jgi:hypothetical protein
MSICGTFTMDSIPAANVDAIVKGYKDNIPPPASVDKAQNPDGTWKVTAQWPPCAAGTAVTHSADN